MMNLLKRYMVQWTQARRFWFFATAVILVHCWICQSLNGMTEATWHVQFLVAQTKRLLLEQGKVECFLVPLQQQCKPFRRGVKVVIRWAACTTKFLRITRNTKVLDTHSIL